MPLWRRMFRFDSFSMRCPNTPFLTEQNHSDCDEWFKVRLIYFIIKLYSRPGIFYFQCYTFSCLHRLSIWGQRSNTVPKTKVIGLRALICTVIVLYTASYMYSEMHWLRSKVYIIMSITCIQVVICWKVASRGRTKLQTIRLDKSML